MQQHSFIFKNDKLMIDKILRFENFEYIKKFMKLRYENFLKPNNSEFITGVEILAFSVFLKVFQSATRMTSSTLF